MYNHNPFLTSIVTLMPTVINPPIAHQIFNQNRMLQIDAFIVQVSLFPT